MKNDNEVNTSFLKVKTGCVTREDILEVEIIFEKLKPFMLEEVHSIFSRSREISNEKKVDFFVQKSSILQNSIIKLLIETIEMTGNQLEPQKIRIQYAIDALQIAKDEIDHCRDIFKKAWNGQP